MSDQNTTAQMVRAPPVRYTLKNHAPARWVALEERNPACWEAGYFPVLGSAAPPGEPERAGFGCRAAAAPAARPAPHLRCGRRAERRGARQCTRPVGRRGSPLAVATRQRHPCIASAPQARATPRVAVHVSAQRPRRGARRADSESEGCCPDVTAVTATPVTARG
jgi:hypothetical protein